MYLQASKQQVQAMQQALEAAKEGQVCVSLCLKGLAARGMQAIAAHILRACSHAHIHR